MPLDTPRPSDTHSPRVAWIHIQGRPILMLDFAGATPAESLAMLDELPKVFEAQDLNSVRILCDTQGVAYDPGVNGKWKAELVKFNPFVRACAVYGGTGLTGVVARAFLDLISLLHLPNAGMKLKSFKSKDSAVEWLLLS
jgi:hypothetical protein